MRLFKLKKKKKIIRFHLGLFRLFHGIHFTLLIAATLTSGVFRAGLQKCPRDRKRENNKLFQHELL